MNRTIKFRGKRIDDESWVYGNLFNWYRRTAVIPIIGDGVRNGSVIGNEVDPETVGQFTGLLDKNGKEIYEGDIIGGSNGSINGYLWPFKSEIKWRSQDCGFNTPNWGYMDSTHFFEVVGNIHDNPELLNTNKAGEK